MVGEDEDKAVNYEEEDEDENDVEEETMFDYMRGADVT
jgi:hypothetical protein